MIRQPKRGRLSRSAEFERVYRQGRSLGNRHLVLYAFASASTSPPRLGLSVSRKVGGAVDRNHVKRLLREAFADVEAGLPSGQDLVVVARPDARELAEREGLAGMKAALAELLARAGLAGGSKASAGGPKRAAQSAQSAQLESAQLEFDGEAGSFSAEEGEGGSFSAGQAGPVYDGGDDLADAGDAGDDGGAAGRAPAGGGGEGGLEGGAAGPVPGGEGGLEGAA